MKSDYCGYVQVSVLDEASRTHPNVWWWIKADGCDLVEGLGESTKLNGVVTLIRMMESFKRCLRATGHDWTLSVDWKKGVGCHCARFKSVYHGCKGRYLL